MRRFQKIDKTFETFKNIYIEISKFLKMIETKFVH